MAAQLTGKTVAILATDGVEQVELERPRQALDDAGATTRVVSPADGTIRAWQHDHWGDVIRVDVPLSQADADRFDALFIPGGVMSPDRLRMNEQAVQFTRRFAEEGKPVAALCHGPWMLVEADVVEGREVTSWPSLQTDLENAGATWVDRQVVTDQGIVTSRKPDDIPAFDQKMIEEFAEGTHTGRRQRSSAAASTTAGRSTRTRAGTRTGEARAP
ncbi:MAG TPA: type 1 glutamine amidotransferase domain-containing protein [Gemmatimonadaceae bacterium]|nr:type 1 glutamine amidotransferase domain-containing protein [Gemmatimonadaceae bacterium]